MIRLRPDTRHGNHNTGPKRTLDFATLMAERAQLWRQPRSSERTAALRLVGRRLERIGKRSPYKEP